MRSAASLVFFNWPLNVATLILCRHLSKSLVSQKNSIVFMDQFRGKKDGAYTGMLQISI